MNLCEKIINISLAMKSLAKLAHDPSSVKSSFSVEVKNLLKKVARQIHEIESSLQNNSFDDIDNMMIKIFLEELLQQAQVIKNAYQHAQTQAKKATEKQQSHLEQMKHLALYGYPNLRILHDLIPPQPKSSRLTPVMLPYTNLWMKLAGNLNHQHLQLRIKKYSQHNVAKLCQSDASFLQMILDAGLENNELGFIELARLFQIATKGSSSQRMKSEKAMTTFIKATANLRENIFFCEWQILQEEIFKALFHAQLNPAAKIAWIGTATAVIAVIEKNRGQGVYLNCDDKLWNWTLNRSWLSALVDLGFQIHLVEQHFPNVESAILKGSTEQFVLAMMQQMRGANDESQYSGKNGTTATTQEILSLIEMGCEAKKLENGRLAFSKPNSHRDDLKVTVTKPTYQFDTAHACPHFFKAAPPPHDGLNVMKNFNKVHKSEDARALFNLNSD